MSLASFIDRMVDAGMSAGEAGEVAAGIFAAGAASVGAKPKAVREAPKGQGQRIPADWALTPDLGNYARSKGLTRNEVIAEAEAFKNFWLSAAGPKARKTDWNLTFMTWCQREAKRLKRTPMATAKTESMLPLDKPKEVTLTDWQFRASFLKSTSNWRAAWGPEPGMTGCRMPQDLQDKLLNDDNVKPYLRYYQRMPVSGLVIEGQPQHQRDEGAGKVFMLRSDPFV